ncbi:AraC family transcriptional regulator [Mucilaginibacter rubeus]|uniref:AraC family transcriptional regulator n=1 Tax=Mucilaginibacter rubeus TaxID=2027860 RepID=A0AAE6JD95_9SPHI|nr:MULTISPECIES: AraC family transcriptional regulator [Mucilaginibacter]QEM03430.1 AraC family transcriptional regulator [Mucilaginibacter rubeus]QEM16045.1 AraC family transcriptional regulator [Mucilaginibacter gossypii]QTE41204.1 AraC family transcriptional regulator [Mucilaginibacter rubeus]QTE47808.1 AraC family transcriptional regulator [Mucilaginibacter rubeus]QTE59199.1 AraC family transcriptional regulator [Mucilaginibacter rubeus]
MSKDKSLRKRDGFDGQRLIVIPKKIVSDFLIDDPITRQVYITDIGYYPRALFHYAQRSQGINQHIIIYCTDGYGWIDINKKRIQIAPSQFIAIPANTPHAYGADEKNPWSIYWAHFKGENARFITDLIVEKQESFKPQLTYSAERIKIFDDIYYNLEKGYGEDTLRYANMSFYHFLSSMIYTEQFNWEKKEPSTDTVESVINFMQDNIEKIVTLKEMADHSQMSVTYFCKIFKKKTGHTPMEYFNYLKIQKACQYLSFTAMSVKELAFRIGIHDQYYFSRMFSRLMGTSPSDYRKRLSESNNLVNTPIAANMEDPSDSHLKNSAYRPMIAKLKRSPQS